MIDQKIYSWKNHCCFLDEHERQDPFEVIKEFCNTSYLFNQREELLEMFRNALLCEHYKNGPDPMRRADAFWGVTEIIKLMEACYLLYVAHETGKLTFKYV